MLRMHPNEVRKAIHERRLGALRRGERGAFLLTQKHIDAFLVPAVTCTFMIRLCISDCCATCIFWVWPMVGVTKRFISRPLRCACTWVMKWLKGG